MKIVVSEFMDPTAVERLRAHFGSGDLLYAPALVDMPERLMAELADCRVLIVRNRTQVRGAILEAAPHLSLVGRLGVGLDNIDTVACADRGIRVLPATGANARAVAEYVLAATLVLRRSSFFSTTEVVAGRWPRAALSSGREAADATLGLIGYGSIGQTTARLARAIGMQVIAYDPGLDEASPAWMSGDTRRCSLEEVISTADVLSLHLPLTDDTRGLLDAKRIASMKRGAILINTARGGVVDETAVAEALRSGQLGGAALDVFEHEPLPASNGFADAPNLILTPHIAGVSFEANVRVSSLIAEAVIAAYPEGL